MLKKKNFYAMVKKYSDIRGIQKTYASTNIRYIIMNYLVNNEIVCEDYILIINNNNILSVNEKRICMVIGY